MLLSGPRPALWNQDLLTSERDKWKANDIKPGLTGWAQINGRDELEIPMKAKLDGDYATNLGLKMDIKCFLEEFVRTPSSGYDREIVNYYTFDEWIKRFDD